MVDLTIRVLYKPNQNALPLILSSLGENYDERGSFNILILLNSCWYDHFLISCQLYFLSHAFDRERNVEERYCSIQRCAADHSKRTSFKTHQKACITRAYLPV